MADEDAPAGRREADRGSIPDGRGEADRGSGPDPGSTPLRVRFGPEAFRLQRHGGVSRYVVELHRQLGHLGVDSGIVAGLHRNALLAGEPRTSGLDVDRLRPARARQAATRVVDRAVAGAAARRLPAGAVWHASYFDPARPRVAARAVTVYDMIHERYPDEVGPRDGTAERKRAACRAADVVFAISEHTARDLQERYRLPADRVVVTPLGVTVAAPSHRPRPFGGRPFLLFVGDRRPAYKNWLLLLDALARLDPEVGLVCVGAPASAGDRAALADRGLGGRVGFAAAGDDATLAGWYAAAAALAYPSRDEGFGLPPLEALAHGCPVVAGNGGAVPEVVGGVALLVEPSVDALVAGIEEVLADGEAARRQRRDGPAHAARFAWAATARRTLDGYRRALS